MFSTFPLNCSLEGTELSENDSKKKERGQNSFNEEHGTQAKGNSSCQKKQLTEVKEPMKNIQKWTRIGDYQCYDLQ
jgi:hypothetical protein